MLKGNVKKVNKGLKAIKKAPKVFWRPFLLRPGIYHWRFFSDDKGHYEEYPLDDKCIEVELFHIPTNGSMKFLWEYNKWQDHLIGDYFEGAFEDWTFHDRSKLRNIITCLIIPERKYFEILNKINEFQLLHIKDLLLETIAISQHIFSYELLLWDTPEYRKLAITAQSEAEKVIKVIELSGAHHKNITSMEENPSPGLSSITFKFEDKTTIKIEHKWLTFQFAEYVMRYYEDYLHDDWRSGLAKYGESYRQSYLKESFQKQLIKAYYNLFTNNKWFESRKRYPSKMMQCISCLLEFSLIPVGQSHYSQARKGKNVLELLRQIHGESNG